MTKPESGRPYPEKQPRDTQKKEGFEQFIGRDPASLTDREKFRLGMSFYDASRQRDQAIAEELGVTPGDSISIAFRRISAGEDLLDEGWENATDVSTPSELD